MAAVFAQFQKAALVPGADQELFEFRRAVVVHAATRVLGQQVPAIQRQVLLGAHRRDDPRVDIRIARQATTLAAVGLERGHRHAHRDAGLAAHATGPVHDIAGTAEAPVQRLRIQLRQARVAWVQDQVARLAVRPVAAGMRAGPEHAYVVGIGAHAPSIAPTPFSRAQGCAVNRRRAPPFTLAIPAAAGSTKEST